MLRKSLTDILRADDRNSLSTAWNSTQPAGDFSPLPTGNYECHVVNGEAFASKTGTPGYKLAFKVLEGDFAGRQVWLDLWLTPAALPMTKRDLAKLGVTELEQLDQPLPSGIRCRVKVALRGGVGKGASCGPDGTIGVAKASTCRREHTGCN